MEVDIAKTFNPVSPAMEELCNFEKMCAMEDMYDTISGRENPMGVTMLVSSPAPSPMNENDYFAANVRSEAKRSIRVWKTLSRRHAPLGCPLFPVNSSATRLIPFPQGAQPRAFLVVRRRQRRQSPLISNLSKLGEAKWRQRERARSRCDHAQSMLLQRGDCVTFHRKRSNHTSQTTLNGNQNNNIMYIKVK